MPRPDDRSTRELAAALGDADGAEWVHLWRTLQQRDDSAADVASVLREAPPDLRQKALGTLTAAGAPDVVAALLDTLGDERRPIRRLAIARLGDAGDSRAVEPLARIVRSSSEPADLHSEAVRALAKLPDAGVGEVIADALDDPDPGVRAAAAEALYDLQDPGAEPALRAALHDDSELVRQWAERALKRGSDTDGEEMAVDLSLPGSWYSDPLMDSQSLIYSFEGDGSGEVEDFNMGVTNERTPFTYRRHDDTLEFRFGEGKQSTRTKFDLEAGTFRHPYKGELPCAVLRFAREPYFEAAPQEDATYYRLAEDE